MWIFLTWYITFDFFWFLLRGQREALKWFFALSCEHYGTIGCYFAIRNADMRYCFLMSGSGSDSDSANDKLSCYLFLLKVI